MDVTKRQQLAGVARATRLPMAIVACIASLVVALPTSAGEPPSTPSSGIHSVWNAQVSCGEFSTVAQSRHPDEAAIKSSGRVELPGTGFTFAYAGLAGMSDMSLLLALDDRSRGVVDHYLLLAEDDLSPPVAAIVITELPAKLAANPRSALLSAVSQQVINAETLMAVPVTFSHLHGTSTTGPAIEMLVPGRTGSPCFPTTRFRLFEEGQAPTIGISLFVPDGRYLVEYSLIVPALMEPGMPNDNIGRARAQLMRFLGSLQRTDEMPPG